MTVTFCDSVECSTGRTLIPDASNVQCKNIKCKEAQCCGVSCSTYACPTYYRSKPDKAKIVCNNDQCNFNTCCYRITTCEWQFIPKSAACRLKYCLHTHLPCA